jgi:ssDNA-binding Zn-finger/Zn-ribbon topoisomerase 1
METLLSGWSLRDFTVEELTNYLNNNRCRSIEISKDLLKTHSIKILFNLINKSSFHEISFAGTTDLINTGNWDFNTYLNYLKIQITQAQFLGVQQFRLLIGKGKSKEIIYRIRKICSEFENIQFITEIHKGWEADPCNLKQLIFSTNLNFLIDFQNIHKSNLSFKQLNNIIPNQRISYFHTRNLGDIYIEDENIINDERIWRNNFPKCIVYWEPKRLTKKEIIKYYEEYQVNN